MKTSTFLIALLFLLAGCATEPERRPPEKITKPKDESRIAEPVLAVKQMSKEEQLSKLDDIRQNMNFEFLMGKGDILAISVYGEPDLNLGEIPIRMDGKISFPLVGDLDAAGLTVDELTQDLTEKLKEFILNPKVSVIVKQFTSLNYTVAGEVTRPGTFPLVTNISLTQAIATAGGLKKGDFRGTTVELADLSHAFISRKNQVLPVDFVRLLRNGDMRFDVPLMPGDYIFIPSGLAQEVYILGEVTSPDLFAFSEDFTVSTALSQARGFTPDADITRIHVVRGSLSNPELYVLNMEAVLAGESKDILLEAGDIVYVPPTGLTVWARMVDKFMPTIQALQTGYILAK